MTPRHVQCAHLGNLSVLRLCGRARAALRRDRRDARGQGARLVSGEPCEVTLVFRACLGGERGRMPQKRNLARVEARERAGIPACLGMCVNLPG